jgi:penicillin-binding protein 2
MKPRLVKAIEDPSTGNLINLPPEVEIDLKIPEDWLALVREAMIEVNISGTGARVMAGTPYRVAGKTGTSQVFSIKQNETYNADRVAERLRDHSLYVAFAPAEDPKVALAVIVENGGFGAAAAAPLARLVMDHLLVERVKEGRALP